MVQTMGLAADLRVIILRKGHRTLITDGSYIYCNCSGNPGMAVGGSGDVLFSDMLSQQVTRDEIVSYFMAMLELLKLGKLHAQQEQAFDDILIMPGRKDGEENGEEDGKDGADAASDGSGQAKA